MKLNEFIDKLIEFRDKNNAGDFEVCTQEVLYDVICGEIQECYLESTPMKDEDFYLNEINKIVQICAQDNGAVI